MFVIVQIGRGTHRMVAAHMLRYMYSVEGALRLKRDVAAYRDCLQAARSAVNVDASFEELQVR